MEFKVTTAFANLVELNICESKFNNTHLVYISKMCNTLGILNVSGCSITDVGIKKASLESLITGASRRLEPVIKCCSFLSFFQCLVSRAPLSAVTESLS